MEDRRFVFVVGKGGVGKTTTAATLALRYADQGESTHLISTDPAHSLRDFFGSQKINAPLVIEEFDARAYADRFFEQLRAPFAELIERGSYLDARDAASFLDLSIPGIDEVMSAFRLVELLDSDARHIIVDTAPTGHALRLLDAADVIDSWINAGRALAEKAGVVATALVGAQVRLQAESILDEWETSAQQYRAILREAGAIVVSRPGHVIEAETERLTEQLTKRGITTIENVVIDRTAFPANVAQPANAAAPWISRIEARLIWVAGKGGVGKSTCASAIATLLGETRRVCLVSTDPAGSLSEILDVSITSELTEVAPGLVARQIDAVGEFNRMRTQYRDAVNEVFESLGLDQSANLDRRVLEAVWDFAPPGIDEIISLIEIVDHANDFDVLVIDSAPTGHFLRLIEMPQIALDWVHSLLRLIVKYGATASLDALARDLLAFAKRLRQLISDLSSGTTAVFVVTLAEPMVRTETARLSTSLRRANVPIAATILNRADDGVRFDDGSRPLIRCPNLQGEVVGPAELSRFIAQWELYGE